ncbi:DUF2326 domain-containing protein [Enterococcus avium]|uniref:DUF2326 domain-containing protein n=1 Tax=Enterococcus avium TaxID=33945 RepID=UPI0028927F03|nr:DUF2326 domain-containing protein [Enterococcus avium]MDT2435621.1 DUF2326 domain-containing protein [Enterococcus avium]MDT2448274.1 DUF2326 domain-containing protein [Enterococcus avium]MDT2465633.1 DUF2326 domain-containing protein [Enterococcus avium]MDT2482714.1 DUF2326 domain-containing protein [Enterococcus avium]MDT2505060.1 DUF2326 domain-containing protein [Enterococcus avium]
MKILSLKINSSSGEEIRNIDFKEDGLTFIYGNVKRPKDKDSTINSLGKTLLLKMIDYILGCNNDPKVMKRIYGYKLIAQVKNKNEVFEVERTITDDKNVRILINDEPKLLNEYKDFFEIDRSELDKQIFLTSKNSELSSRETPSKFDYDTIFELLHLNDIGEKITEIYNLQDKLKELEKEKKRLISSFSKYLSNNETLEEKIFIVDKNVQEMKDNLDEVSRKISSMDTLPYKEQALKEYEETNKNYKRLKGITLQRRTEKRRLEKYLDEVKNVQVTKDQLEKLFSKAKIEIPEMIIKEIDEVENFHNSVINDRVVKIESSIKKLESQIKANNEILEKNANEISRLSVILAENKAYQESLALYGDYNERLQNLIYQQGQLSQAKEITDLLIKLNNDLNSAFSDAANVIKSEETNSLITEYREFVYNLVQKIYSPSVATYFSIGVKDKHKTRRPVEFTLNMKGETGEGISEVKKNIVDYLIFYFNESIEMLIQDSSCYNGIDPRQVSNMLVELNKLAFQSKKQAIVAINQYQLDADIDNEVHELIDDNYGIVLDEDNKLLKFDF